MDQWTFKQLMFTENSRPIDAYDFIVNCDCSCVLTKLEKIVNVASSGGFTLGPLWACAHTHFRLITF